MSDPSVGPIDTNVFLHAETTDHLSEECRRFLRGLTRGEVSAYLDPLVSHEVSCLLRRYLKQCARVQVAEYMLNVLSWPGIHADKPLLLDAVHR